MKKLNIMFTMVNTLSKKQIQQNQELKWTECKNLEIEIQFVQPQIRAHWNKVLRRRDFKRSKGLSLSSNMWVLHSCQTNHIKHAGTIFQMVDRCFPNQFQDLQPTTLKPYCSLKLKAMASSKSWNNFIFTLLLNLGRI